MKRFVDKTKGLVRGTPTAVLISAVIHGVLLLLATGFVVFTIMDKKEVNFVPQKIDRPKMKLKKLRVKVKEQAKPRKTTQRIASTRKSADLPDIQLPEMTGMGAGLEGGIGGFDMMADLSKMTLMGAERSVGNDLEGTLYHLKRDAMGELIPGVASGQWEVNTLFKNELNNFLANNWDTRILEKYYRSPKKLYATHIMLPAFASDIALDLYGLPDDWEAGRYLILYKGEIAYSKGGRFRFWGTGDDLLFVRIGGKLVLDARTSKGGSYPSWTEPWRTPNNWKSNSPENMKHLLGTSTAKVGDWFTLEPGVPVKMEVLLGEDMGGRTSAMLNIQEEGVEYPKNKYGSPILPAFKMAKIPEHVIDELEYLLIPGDTDLRGGPIFNAY